MPIAPFNPPLAPEPLLTADHVRAVLDACGYRSTTVRFGGARVLPAGCRMSLQFGDLIATGADGATCLTVRCSIVINGGDESVIGVSSWQIRKVFPVLLDTVRLNIAIEADLLLGSGVLIEELLSHSEEIHHHLRLLIGDMRATLQELPIHDEPGQDIDAPVLRIDARFAGDLAAGRCGIVGSQAAAGRKRSAVMPRVARRHLHLSTAVCDCLANDVVAELARTIHGISPERSPQCGAGRAAVIAQSLALPSHSVVPPRTQSVSPGSDAATTPVVPLQSSTSIH